MLVSEVINKMIDFSNGNLHDINHFMKVWGFARTIGLEEGLDNKTQEILEVTAVVHDIACPLCRVKYGNTNGKYQEAESEPLLDEFFSKIDTKNFDINRVKYIVSHHHTYTNVDGIDYQIMLEADYLVNTNESNYSKEQIEEACKNIFKTKTGINLLKSMYLYNER